MSTVDWWGLPQASDIELFLRLHLGQARLTSQAEFFQIQSGAAVRALLLGQKGKYRRATLHLIQSYYRGAYQIDQVTQDLGLAPEELGEYVHDYAVQTMHEVR